MSAARHARLGELFWDALQQTGEDRERFLASVEADDPSMREAVEGLLAADAVTASPLAETEGGIGIELLSDALDAEHIGPYQIVRRIGEGGMGRVYEAVQRQPDRRVALKIMRPGRSSAEMLRRFEREIRSLGRLEHPGIVRAYDAGSFDAGDGQRPFLVMEYVEGMPLTVAAADLSRSDRIMLMVRIADAIDHAHDRGVIHRDLKPDNIIVDSGGMPRILDFGVARDTGFDDTLTSLATSPGQIIGTLSYMSPEQCSRDRAVDHRADVYAMGAILFELMSGRLPHDLAGRPLAEAARVLAEDDATALRTVDATLRGDLDVISATALARDPRHRYPSARAFADDLRRHLSDQPIHARRPNAAYRVAKFVRRNRLLVAAAAAIGVTLVGATVVSTRYAVQAQRDRVRAEDMAAASGRSVYKLAIGQAQAALAGRDLDVVDRSLDMAAESLRGWEWRYLQARRDPMISFAAGIEVASTTTVGFDGGRPRLVASVGEDAVVMDGVSGAVLWRATQTSDRAVALAPDGRRVAVLRPDHGTVEFGPVDDGANRRTIDLSEDLGQLGEVMSIRIATGRDRMLVVTDRTTLMLDLTAGAVVGRWPVAKTAVPSPDGEHVLAVVEDEDLVPQPSDDATAAGRKLVLWSMDGSERHLPGRPWFKDRAESLAFSPSGERVAVTVASLVVRVVDLRADAVVFEGASVDYRRGWGLSFLGESQLVVPGGDLSARILDLDGEEIDRLPIRTSQARGDARMQLIAATPDQRSVFLASEVAACLHPIDRSSGVQLAGHDRYVYCAAWSPCGSVLATAGWDDSVRLWCGLTGESIAVLPVDGRDTCVASLTFSPDGRFLRATVPPRYRWATTPMHRRTWDLVSGAVVDDRPDIHTALAESTGGTTFAGMSTLDKSKIISSGACVVMGMDGRHVVGAIAGLRAMLVDLETGDEVEVAGTHRSTLSISPDGRELMFVNHRSNRIERLSFPGLEPIGTMVTNHAGEIFSIAWSPDATRVVTSGRDRLIRVWDVATGDLMATLDGHDDYVHAVVFSPDGTRLASVSGDTTGRIWDTVPMHLRREQASAGSAVRRSIESWASGTALAANKAEPTMSTGVE